MIAKNNYLAHPLPPRFLTKRLKPVKDLVQSRPSGIILGCPGSGRTALVKFLFETKKKTLIERKKIIFFAPSGLEKIDLGDCLYYFSQSWIKK